MILVTGATGTVGGTVVRLLSDARVPLRALVRRHAQAKEFALPCVETVFGDFRDPGSLGNALQGVDTALLITPFLPDQDILQTAFVAEARSAGVRRIVKLSCTGADPASKTGPFRQHGVVEASIQASGMDYTFLRPTGFLQNLLGSAISIAQGMLLAPMGDAAVALVDARDVAGVAARTLTDPRCAERVYELTGPKSVTYADIAAELTEAIGRPVRYVEISPRDFRESLVAYAVPEWMADGMNEIFAAFRAGAAKQVTDTVSQLLSRPANSMRAFAKEHARKFGLRGSTS